ncbi:MAG: metallophosphoesterase [Minwuia sp.]|nr:metallophosphoesterase [Minwuia sp.]
MRVYAIGDIHGRADMLDELHRMISDDAAGWDGDRIIVYLGDYIDRGMHNREVLDTLIHAPLTGFRTIHLIGNHEAVLLQFLQDAEIARDWIKFGGDTTLASYGVRLPRSGLSIDALLEAKAILQRNMPPEHLAFLRSLRLNYWIGDYMFVHAGVRPGIALDRQDGNDMIWIRKTFLESRADFGKVIVHGHTPVLQPEVHHNRISIDTGAFFSGHLTALVLQGAERRFLST